MTYNNLQVLESIIRLIQSVLTMFLVIRGEIHQA
jgi:hypothetical protein